MNTDGKACTRCHEFKPLDGFYKQGDRIESVCKKCKQDARKERQQKKLLPPPKIAESTNAEIQPDRKTQSSEELNLTKEDFLEIVDFFQELIRLDKLKG